MNAVGIFDVYDKAQHLTRSGDDTSHIKVESMSKCITTIEVGTRDPIKQECACGV